MKNVLFVSSHNTLTKITYGPQTKYKFRVIVDVLIRVLYYSFLQVFKMLGNIALFAFRILFKISK